MAGAASSGARFARVARRAPAPHRSIDSAGTASARGEAGALGTAGPLALRHLERRRVDRIPGLGRSAIPQTRTRYCSRPPQRRTYPGRAVTAALALERLFQKVARDFRWLTMRAVHFVIHRAHSLFGDLARQFLER